MPLKLNTANAFKDTVQMSSEKVGFLYLSWWDSDILVDLVGCKIQCVVSHWLRAFLWRLLSLMVDSAFKKINLNWQTLESLVVFRHSMRAIFLRHHLICHYNSIKWNTWKKWGAYIRHSLHAPFFIFLQTLIQKKPRVVHITNQWNRKIYKANEHMICQDH